MCTGKAEILQNYDVIQPSEGQGACGSKLKRTTYDDHLF